MLIPVLIQPGIGSVDLDGSIPVSPTETTTYTITATDTVTVAVLHPITLTIASPNDGETISRPDIMVEGTTTKYYRKRDRGNGQRNPSPGIWGKVHS